MAGDFQKSHFDYFPGNEPYEDTNADAKLSGRSKGEGVFPGAGDAGDNANCEVDDKESAPELFHSEVGFVARSDVPRLHICDEDRKAEGQRDKKEVEHSNHCKLQPAQCHYAHGFPPVVKRDLFDPV